jgi:hypothetical protein
MSRLERLHAMGFDRSEPVPFTRTFHVRCSRCAALVINGFPVHERGCPNEPDDDDEEDD